MSFFDDSHVMDLQGSVGPAVSPLDMLQQSIRQQFRVDSARALDEELRHRWLESLSALRTAGQNFNAPVNANMYRGYAEFVREGTPVTVPTVEGTGYGARFNTDVREPDREFEEMRRANEAIRALNNPEIKTFEQILEEVSAMQQGVEEQTASMSQRAGWGGFLGELAGGIIGSFTPRDPLNIVTAPWGAGRTIATRIGTEMLIAAGVVTATEYGDVQPARALAQLPDRNPLFNIAAATLGAGIIRGGIEGIGAGVRRFRQSIPEREEIDFDLRDSQLQQMFDNALDTPTTRAGVQALDDAIFIERNNPYGEGQAAQARFLAELQDMQRAMNGEPMTAVARVLPPVPFEYIKKAADFEIVREQRPLVYARMEQAQARLADLTRQANEAAERLENFGPTVYYHGSPIKGLTGLREGDGTSGWLTDRGIYFSELRENVEVYTQGKGEIYEARLNLKNPYVVTDPNFNAATLSKEVIDDLRARGYDGVVDKRTVTFKDLEGNDRNIRFNETIVFDPSQVMLKTVSSAAASRRAANAEYQTAYRAVEAEAVRLREAQARIEAAQQRESASIFLPTAEGRLFIGPTLQHGYVESLVDRINKFNDTLDEQAVARFIRKTEAEGEEILGRTGPLVGEPLPKRGLAPAFFGKDGTIYVGPEGGLHSDIKLPKDALEDIDNWATSQIDGFVTPEGRYLTREEANRWVEERESPEVLARIEGEKSPYMSPGRLEADSYSRRNLKEPVSWMAEDGRIDIGLREPVDPEFRFDTDEGELTVAAAMRDLQDDADLDEAMRTCLR